MCCGVVSLCQTADKLQVVCARHGLTDCVISPVSHTFMPFTHNSPTFYYFYPAGTGSWTSRSLFSPSVEITSEVVNLTHLNFHVHILKTAYFHFILCNCFFCFFEAAVDHDITCDSHFDWLKHGGEQRQQKGLVFKSL